MTSETMTSVSLSNEEVEIVRGLVSEALSALREEVYRTENYDLRQELKQREVLLNDVARRLGA